MTYRGVEGQVATSANYNVLNIELQISLICSVMPPPYGDMGIADRYSFITKYDDIIKLYWTNDKFAYKFCARYDDSIETTINLYMHKIIML